MSYIHCCPLYSFGKQPLWYDGRRGSECLILEHSEMIVVSDLLLLPHLLPHLNMYLGIKHAHNFC